MSNGVSAADIVAAAREFADGLDVSLTEAGNARIHITRLADTIEQLITDLDARFENSDHQSAKYYQRMRAAEREMHARELHHFEEEQKSAGLAAVIEKAQQAGEVTGYSHHKEPVMKALDTAPADALREHDAALIESLADDRGVDASEDHDDEWWVGYRQAQREIVHWLTERARQVREGEA